MQSDLQWDESAIWASHSAILTDMSHFIRGVLLSGVQSLFARQHQSIDIRCERNFHANQDSLVRMTSRNRLIVYRIQSRSLLLCQPLGILFQGRPRLIVMQVGPSHRVGNDVGFRKRYGLGSRLIVFLDVVRLRKRHERGDQPCSKKAPYRQRSHQEHSSSASCTPTLNIGLLAVYVHLGSGLLKLLCKLGLHEEVSVEYILADIAQNHATGTRAVRGGQ